MPLALAAVTDLLDPPRAGFDEIIDVRSPDEYAEDHLPGAVNLPALSNDERARVGTIYVQESPFRARRIGAALVARNVARHLETHLADKSKGYRPLLYCWRGGQRSNAFATILRQIGWQAEVVEGGWRSWRRLVQHMLYRAPFPAPVVVLDGNTGTAKTELLHLMAARGAQVIDLEGLARHRGSIFGARAGGQPAQKGFESALAVEVARLDPARPVVVEAESSKIGALGVPPSLWQAMAAAPRLRLTAPLEARAGYLARAYTDISADPQALGSAIEGLRAFHPAERIAHWHALAAEGAFAALAGELMEHHYDPRYAKARARQPDPGGGLTVEAEALDPSALERLADRLCAALGELPQGVA
ncbi:tRNA 2-selenouridine(34) synthase MnmH [Rhodobacteraceae bacterium WD3A24]|nr:tRNA 2-selenouridine(34) synthase MnmH [Rhodobacteraceae bacterium WD3A24]